MFSLFKPKITSQSSRKKRAAKGVAFLFALSVLGVLVWLGGSLSQLKNKVISRNSTGGSILFHKKTEDVKPAELKGEGDGRVNIVFIGIDQAASLADTLEVFSLDLQNHKAAMVSVPRDLWAKIPGYGLNKINASYSLGERTKKGNGPDVAVQTVSQLLDLPIHYYVRLNFQGLKRLVDAVGGITVDVENPIDDYTYPDEHNGYLPAIHIKAGVQTMDGDLALKYARSRHALNPGEGSDFARSRRQQKVILALKEKALSAGVLTNPVRVNEILHAIGDNLNTNMQTDELQQLIKMSKDLDTTNIITKVLDTAPDSPLTGGQIDERGYIITPKDGDYTYKSLQRIAHEIFTDPYLAKEKSTIEIRNATAKPNLGSSVSATLKSYGYNVVKVGNNPKKELFTELIDYSRGKNPFTQSFLEKRFSLKARQAFPEPGTTAQFVIILGADYTDTKVSLK